MGVCYASEALVGQSLLCCATNETFSGARCVPVGISRCGYVEQAARSCYTAVVTM
ncbi:hypothetical protein BAUCODRAFT_124152 [Baudoinia panamericana UAMH 10762]|uniref:Uncharacterized protein n=1 Tax=Baudoinia panamericana (strain UAMH 10762) TaxID=717646 RepID=M2N681_BAUPA|nr:uncharacterized protein BAUCODRAFT_124152 [Baudoinia panamericana UAMH 10762]EMC94534.1 hypothetical protein BAUCODRAFT_124152 [Baudoinia panamericana UAMH 10762]